MRDLRILYQAKNNTTGLTDVKAQIYLNGTAKAVGGSAVTLSEVDATNSPGLYELLLASATLAGYGVTAGAYNCLEGYIDSPSKSAKAPFRVELTDQNLDDISDSVADVQTTVDGIDTKLGTPAGASVSADIAAVKSDTSAIKSDIEGSGGLADIYAGIQALQRNAGFSSPVPAHMIIPASGSTPYRLPVTVYDEINELIDPDSSVIKISVKNQAGMDAGSYLRGNTPAVAEIQTVTTVADVAGSLNNKYFFLNEPAPGVGIYVWFNVGGTGIDPGPFGGRTAVPVAISINASDATVASAVNTALNLLSGRFSSSVASNVATVTNSVAGDSANGTAENSGFALAVSTAGVDAYVNATRDSLGQYSGYIDIPDTATSDDELIFSFDYAISSSPTSRKAVSLLEMEGASGTAQQSTLLTVKSEVEAIQTDLTDNVEGSGFDNSTDSLREISVYMRANLFVGGRAV